MPRARSQTQDDWQTAAATEGSGCLSGYILPPLAALLIGCLLALLAFHTPSQAESFRADSPPSTSGISPFFTAEIQHWADDITRWAAASNLDPNLVAVIMQIESCGNPRARSRAGAMGLFQVMPFHFRATDNPYEPETNATRGLAYLARSLQAAQGDARLALAGYNGGIGIISRAEWAWPAETKRYVRYGAPMYEDARRGTSDSPTLDEWFKKYGTGMCRQARQQLGLP